jgi:hypothetical protein
MSANPTNGAPSAPGGDLIIREKSSPSAPEINVTASYTQGQGDVSDPEVSYDGKKIVFAMRCPTSNTSTIGDQPACTGRWNIWEYDTTEGGLAHGTFRRLTSSSSDDDADPAYLPGGRGFVFTSNRQLKSSRQALGRTYFALDEYERERVMNLHTMDADGGNITQISVNQSHDRNPVVRPNGDIMFSRWDHVGGRNHFKIFRVKPDGTDMFVLYGAHSEGNSFLHPRDMDPKGQYKGQVSSDLMPLSGTKEGGALVFVDVANYSEQNTPVNPQVPAQGGQMQPTDDKHQLNFGRGLSPHGRVTTPYPLWDGTDVKSRATAMWSLASSSPTPRRAGCPTATARVPKSRPMNCRTTRRPPTPSTCSTRPRRLGARWRRHRRATCTRTRLPCWHATSPTRWTPPTSMPRSPPRTRACWKCAASMTPTVSAAWATRCSQKLTCPPAAPPPSRRSRPPMRTTRGRSWRTSCA